MSDRVSSAQFALVERSDIVAALERLRGGVVPTRFADSNLYDLLHEGRRYPTKAVAALAVQRVLGRIPGPSDFSGGDAAASTRVLLERGFEVVTKLRRVGTLDASFSLGRGLDEEFVIVESRGPDRNTDYRAGLEQLLLGLGDEGIAVLDAFVDSTRTRAAGTERKSLELIGRHYPVRITGRNDAMGLALDLGRAAAAMGRKGGAAGSGNPTKRLRLVIDVPEDEALPKLADRLAGRMTLPVEPSKPFRFVPSKPSEWQVSAERRASEPKVVRLNHKRMQTVLYGILVADHGENKVSCEHPMASGMPADLLVETSDGLLVFEVKTAPSPRECIREALGQLLEYGFWPGSEKVSGLVVVGPQPIDTATQSYLEVLREQFRLPLTYPEQPIDCPSPEKGGAA